MLNLQTGRDSVLLGAGRWGDDVKNELREERCVCCDGPLCLSDDEILTDFLVLDPQEAWGDERLLEQIAHAQSTVEHGQQLALVRWKDGVESLVVFPVEDTAPRAAILTAAYWNGCSTEHLSDLLEHRWGTP